MDPSGEFSFWEAVTKAAEDAHARGEFELAEKHYRQAIDQAAKAFGSTHVTAAHSWLYFGDFLEHQERYGEAETAYRCAVEIYDKYGHLVLFALSLRNLAQVVCAQGRHNEGGDLRNRARVILSKAIEQDLR